MITINFLNNKKLNAKCVKKNYNYYVFCAMIMFKKFRLIRFKINKKENFQK